MTKVQLQFVEIDVASLSSNQQAKWAALLEAKMLFKASLQALAPEGHSIQFSDKYGKLKIALTKASSAAAQPAKQSLADFIASQQLAGRKV
jgi:hypothetical protein